MPQIGWLEILAVVIIAILVLGPKEFPIALKRLEIIFNKTKNYLSNVQKEISSATENVENNITKNLRKKRAKRIKMSENNNNTFSSHFIELRSRLIKSIVFILLIFIISYTFAQEIYNFLINPYAEAVKNDGTNRRLIFTALHETFLTYLKVAFFSAIFWQPSFIDTNMEVYSSRNYTIMKKALITLPYINTNFVFIRRNVGLLFSDAISN